MKKTLFILMFLASMMVVDTGLRAQEVTITLQPGWNWISYPNTVAMEFSDVLEGFVPMDGDMIKSQIGSSMYIRGHWVGRITQFIPGCGYKYYSNRTENVDLSFGQAVASDVVTATPTDITAVSAIVGGMVTLPESSHVFMRGVCWSTDLSPDIDDNHTSEGTSSGGFINTLEGLNPNTTYYVRAYVVSDFGLSYGEEMSFTTENGSGVHDYVDLGLPSGLLWATCNVGATAPEQLGDFFAWAETQPKGVYSWSSYQYCNGNYSSLTKYCNNPYYGNNGFTDNLNTLLPGDDAATANWGDDWRMPTKEEWQELYQNTTQIWTTHNGVNGKLFTASNGNSIFLPAAGYRIENRLVGVNVYGKYWSSTFNEGCPYYARDLIFGWSNCLTDSYCRYGGLPVRAVRSSSRD